LLTLLMVIRCAEGSVETSSTENVEEQTSNKHSRNRTG
jgi:hypothetical protein